MMSKQPLQFPADAPTLPELRRTTKGLRDALFDEIDAIRNGTGDVSRAQAVTKLAQQIINVARAEMEFYKLARGEGPEDLVERARITAVPSADTNR